MTDDGVDREVVGILKFAIDQNERTEIWSDNAINSKSHLAERVSQVNEEGATSERGILIGVNYTNFKND